MVWFKKIGQIEHKYAFEDAVASANTFNGAFGTVTAGAFAVGAGASKVVMNLEVGDLANLATYPIAAGDNVRVCDLTKFDGETFQIYGDELPATIAVGDKLVSNATGALEVDADATAPYYEVTKLIPNTKGVEVVLHVELIDGEEPEDDEPVVEEPEDDETVVGE